MFFVILIKLEDFFKSTYYIVIPHQGPQWQLSEAPRPTVLAHRVEAASSLHEATLAVRLAGGTPYSHRKACYIEPLHQVKFYVLW